MTLLQLVDTAPSELAQENEEEESTEWTSGKTGLTLPLGTEKSKQNCEHTYSNLHAATNEN